MAKVKKRRRTEIVKKKQDTQLPAFMQEEQVTGVEELGQFIIPPRVKIVQAQSGGVLKELFDVGDLVLVPTNILLAPFGEPVLFTPVFFFPEWVLANPVGVKPFLRDRSTDPKSEVARNARNRVSFECPEKPGKYCQYTQHLNFVSVIHNMDLPTPVVITFARSNHSEGQSLAAKIRMRKAPIFGCVFQMNAVERDNAEGNWVGLEISNPETPFIEDEEDFNSLKETHLELKDIHEQSMLHVDFENDDGEEDEEEEDGEY